MKKLFGQPPQFLSIFYILVLLLCAGLGIRKSIQIQIPHSLEESEKLELIRQAREAGLDLTLENNTEADLVIGVSSERCHSQFVTQPDFDHIQLELVAGSCQMTFHVFESENEVSV